MEGLKEINLKSSSIQTIQRREVPRFFTNEIVLDIKSFKSNIHASGNAVNISEMGLVSNIDKPLFVSDRVDMKIKFMNFMNNAEFECKGRIVWVEEIENKKFQCGINFLELENKEKFSILEKYLENNLSKLKLDERREKSRRKLQTREKNIDNRKNERRINKTVFLKCVRYNRIKKLMSNGNYFYCREFQSATANTIHMNGKSMLMFGSNNYFGLANHPEVVEALIKTAEKYGAGSGGSRVLCGTMDLHNELEHKLAEYIGGENCLTYSIGYGANLGLVSALLNENDYLLIDENAHASILDGAFLGKTNIIIYKHNNMGDLKNKLRKLNLKSSKLIATEGIFSMDGDICPLNEIYALGSEYNTGILLDEAHATGILGKSGRGTAEHFGLEGKIDIIMGTMSKTIGCIGGFVVANKDIIHYLKHMSKPFLFTTSLPPAIVAAILKSLEIIKRDFSLRNNLLDKSKYVVTELKKSGFNTGVSETQIIPVIFKNELDTYKVTKLLQDKGIFVSPVGYPAVKKNASRVRISIMATHNYDELDYLIDSLRKIGKDLNLI